MGNLIAADAPRPAGIGRLLVVGAIALAFVLLAIAASLFELQHDHELRHQYEGALVTTHLAFDAQSLASRMHALQQIASQPAANPESAAATLRAAVQSVDVDVAEWTRRAADAAARDSAPEPRAHLLQLRSAIALIREILGRSVGAPEAGVAMPAEAPAGADANFLMDPDRAYLAAVEAAQGTLLNSVRSASDRAVVGAYTVSEIAAAIVTGASALALLLAAVLAAMVHRAQHESRATIGILGEMLRTDPLTGVTNRRGLAENLPVEMSRAKRSSTPLTVAMLDLDYFKRYNSRRGHAGGDSLLRTASQSWRSQLRPSDMLVRYGGEEFTLVLPLCDSRQACQLIERLRPVLPDSQTFSAGVATWDYQESGDELLRRADQSLLLAKRQGRNRTVVAGEEEQAVLPLSVV